MKIGFLVLLVLLCSNTFAYDQMDRFILFEDRLNNMEQFAPYGEDFVVPIDLYAAISPDSGDVTDDADKVKSLGAAALTEGQEILRKYDKTEHVLHIKPINWNIRLPRFHIADWGFVPALRVKTQFGLLMGVRTGVLQINGETALLIVGSSITNNLPEATKTHIRNKTFTANDPVMANDAECTTAGLNIGGDPAHRFACDKMKTYYIPDVDSPTLFAYAKGEAKAGFHFNYYSPAKKTKGNHYFYGEFFPYAAVRSDLKIVTSAETLVNGVNPIDDYEPSDNTQTYVFFDYKIGYAMKPFNFYASIEEVKLMEGSDKSKNVAFENDPLLRVHADGDFRFGIVKLNPFVGIHKRSNYGISDGFYLGVQAGLSFFNDKFKILPRAIMDKEHFTLGVNLKAWIFHIDPYVKLAIKSEVDDVKVPTIVGINLRAIQF